jgi:hypothetical protein
MKLNTVKRITLGGLLALSVAGGTLAPLMAGHAAAGGAGDCPPLDCPPPSRVRMASAADGGLRDGSKLVIGSGSNRDASKPTNSGDSIKPGSGGDFHDGGRASQTRQGSDGGAVRTGDISF